MIFIATPSTFHWIWEANQCHWWPFFEVLCTRLG